MHTRFVCTECTLFQSTHDAARSCAEHGEIVAALEAGDRALALRRMHEHILSVAHHLGKRSRADDPLASLRVALEPLAASARPPVPPSTPATARRGLFTSLVTPPSPPRPTPAARRRTKEN